MSVYNKGTVGLSIRSTFFTDTDFPDKPIVQFSLKYLSSFLLETVLSGHPSIHLDLLSLLLLFVCTYFHAYIHLRFKHAVLRTHLSCVGCVSRTVS